MVRGLALCSAAGRGVGQPAVDGRHRPDDEDPLIFAGSASPRLTAAVCRELQVEVGSSEVIRFSEGTLFVRVLENVRGRSVTRAEFGADVQLDEMCELAL